MSRVVLPVALCAALAVAGCAVSSANLSTGFASNATQPKKAASLNSDNRGALGGDPLSSRKGTPGNTKVARADDKAPAGQYWRAYAIPASTREACGADRMKP